MIGNDLGKIKNNSYLNKSTENQHFTEQNNRSYDNNITMS